MRVRIARDGPRRVRELTHTIDALEAEIAELVAQVAPQLVAERGCGPLTAAKLVGELAGADRCGNRQLNATIHRMAVARARCDPQTRDDIARKKAEGKTNRDANSLPQTTPRPPRLAAPTRPRPVQAMTPTINFLT